MKFDLLLDNYNDREERPIPRESLDSAVFQFFEDGRSPILQDGIKAQIIQDLQSLEEVAPVIGATLIGNILTPYFHERCNIDVYLELDPEAIDNISTAGLFFNLKRLTGRLAIGTKHKIFYHMYTQEINIDNLEAAYDVINERWLKRPDSVDPYIIEIITAFNETIQSIDGESGKVLRDRIDITEIRKLNKGDLQVLRFHIQQQLDRLNENLEYIVQIYPEQEKIKRLLNDETLTTIEITVLGQSLPDFVKMMFYKKYYFIKFIQRVDQLLIPEDEFDVQALVNTNPAGKAFGRV